MMMSLRTFAVAAFLVCPFSASLAQNQIPVVVRWEGDTQPSEITVQEDSGPIRLRTNASARSFEGNIPASPRTIRQVPLEIRYGSVTFPLELRVRPATRNIEFTIISNRPESCSGVYVTAVQQYTTSPEMAMRRALSATYMLAREVPPDNCTHHRAAVLQARYQRYVNLMRWSPHFVIPSSIEISFLEEMAQLGQGNTARALVDRSREQQVASNAMVLQDDVFAALRGNSVETALASSQAIQDLAQDDATAAEVIFGSQIGRDALARQISDLSTRVALVRESVESQATSIPPQ